MRNEFDSDLRPQLFVADLFHQADSISCLGGRIDIHYRAVAIDPYVKDALSRPDRVVVFGEPESDFGGSLTQGIRQLDDDL